MSEPSLFTASGHFCGGLVLTHHKRLATDRPIQPAVVPDRLTIALAEHPNQHPQALVKAGERVAKYQCLTLGDGARPVPVYAPIGGVVEAISTIAVAHPAHPAGLHVPAIVLRTDTNTSEQRLPEIDCSDPQAIRLRIAEAGIVGLGGALFPTAEKLAKPPIDTLIINGAECEPYIACDEALMLEQTIDIVRGSVLAAEACGAERIIIAIEDHRPESRERLLDAIRSNGDQRLRLAVVPTRYPEGGERQLIQVLTGQEVPSGGLPQDLGLATVNIGTACAIADAVDRGIPLTERVVSVTGPGINQPGNFRALIGTAVRYLIAAAGGYHSDAERLIMGGPMMGVALPNDDLPVTRACNCLLVLNREQLASSQDEMPCIRCMDCVAVCPASLLPQQLHLHIRNDDLQASENLNLFDCIECGCCAEVCPSHIPLVADYRFAKARIRHERLEKQRADRARERHQARQDRLAKQRAEREARLKAKQEKLEAERAKKTAGENDNPKDAIAAAVARAKAKKKASQEDDAS